MFRRLFLLPVVLPLLLSGCGDDDPVFPADETPPTPVVNLQASVVDGVVTLTFTATGDDGRAGQAYRYDARYAPAPIDTDNWEAAHLLVGLPGPSPSGTAETIPLPDLDSGGNYYFALKVIDNSGNASALSNVAMLDRLPPSAITDLEVVEVTGFYVDLRLTAPADNDSTGRARSYDVRYATAPIDEASWVAATRVAVPSPGEPGVKQTIRLRKLPIESDLHLRMTARDLAGNTTDLSNEVAFTTPWAPPGWWEGFAHEGLDGIAYRVTEFGGDLVFGGRFTHAGTLEAKAVAAWNGSAWRALGSGLEKVENDGTVYDFCSWQGGLMAVGEFRRAGAASLWNVASWNGSTWTAPGVGVSDPVLAAVGFGDFLYFGGEFRSVNTGFLYSVLQWPGSGAINGTWREPLPELVKQLTPYQGRLYATGAHQRAELEESRAIAVYDGTGWSPLPVQPRSEHQNQVITAAWVHAGELHVAGNFTRIGDLSIPRLARWNGTDWNPVGTGITNDPDLVIQAMTTYEGDLVVAGFFDRIGGVDANNIARFDGTAWHPLGEGIGGGPDLVVLAMAEHDGHLYVCGRFDRAGGLPSLNVARWTGSWTR